MQSLIRVKVDEIVYEYSCFVWGSICDEKPQKVVNLLSEGKGIVSKKDSPTHEKISLLMQKVNLFVPRVRMEKDFGYRTLNARWYSSLLKRKKSMKCLPVYLCDAVNQIIVKPYQDQIRQLRESIRTEIHIQKEKKSLTPEQAAKVKDVTAKINDQKKKLAHQPKCTNDILTTLLHEYVDSPSQDDVVRLQNLTNEITSLETVLKTYMERIKETSDDSRSDSRLSLENMIEDSKSKINQRKRQQYEIRKKYYEKFHREMTPQAIADQLMKYPETFWGQFNRNINMIDVSVKIYSNNKSGKKGSKKQSTLAKRGEALLLFPHAVLDTKVDEEFLADIDNDLKVYEEWDVWAREHPERVFSESYKEVYENYRKQFNTIPSLKPYDSDPEDEYYLIPPTETEMKCMELTEYLEGITVDDEVGRKKVKAANDIIWKFCNLHNFEERYSQLQRMIDSGTVKFPGGFAVGEITKMLNPEYIPNIR
jgi:hypothetical protein